MARVTVECKKPRPVRWERNYIGISHKSMTPVTMAGLSQSDCKYSECHGHIETCPILIEKPARLLSQTGDKCIRRTRE